MSVSAPVVLPPPPAPPAAARRSRTTVLALFGGAMVGAIVLAVLLTVLNSGNTVVEETCTYPDPCGPPRQAAELVALRAWASPLGYSFRYDPEIWSVTERSDADVVLIPFGRDDVAFHIVGVTGVPPQQALEDYVGSVATNVPDLAEDTRAFRIVLGAAVGYRDGVGASYSGHVRSAQGPGPIVTMSAMAAQVGKVTVVVSMEMTGDFWVQVRDGAWPGEDAFQAADSIVNTVRWTAA